jgi:hypothetical protein
MYDYQLHVEKAKKSLAEAERHAALIQKATILLPPGLPINRIHPHTYKGDVSIEMAVDDRNQVLPLAKITGAVPLVVYKDSCTALFPAEKLTDRGRERGKYFEFSPSIWWEAEYHYWWDGSTHAQAIWYFKLEDLMVKAECIITKDPSRIWEEIVRNNQQQIMSRMWIFENFPEGELIRFASGERSKPGKQVKYNLRGEEWE